ncbi:VWA domain-containing protein [Flavivirga aquatica]|uniref:VWA domain-containing protein n=1 Tax=Flavivirga aquatica TaxID=1849968 RepID=UPI000A4BD5DE|nr:VWA domain-containing protein [Flavivirga aquatica]
MKRILKAVIILMISIQLQAQERIISGIVTSVNDNLPLPGVNVKIKGTEVMAITDFDGVYEIKAKESDILVFSYLGFITKDVTVGKQTMLSVILEEDSQELDEVVIVGYGVVNKKEVTASVSLSKSQLKRQKQKAYHNKLSSQIQSNSIVKALQGQVAGVNVANNSGKPNSQILIRGINSVSGNRAPLVVIDGVVSSYKNLEQINPNNIEAIDVLKDSSSSAIYGARASNGIILISTNAHKNKTIKEPLYIVDGVPIKKENNHIIKNLPKSDIDNKKQYNKSEAKKKFGKIAKNGCIVITTNQGNFRIHNNESYTVIEENSFERTSISPLSTFSIDVDKASYSNIRRMINNGVVVEPDAVKIEEMINYFDYNYPQPVGKHPFSINTEVAKTPWNKDTKIVKVGLQGKTFSNDALPASNLTFLIDVSGSMSSQNKLPLLKSAFKLLVNQLREKDKVSIVVYAGAAGVVLEPTSGKDKKKIMKALDNLQSGGSTAGGEGIELAYALAAKHFKKKGNNRVILATDGDFNVGASSDKAMEKLIEKKRESGVFLSVLGFGYGNYKDSKLEILADKGNGNHAYIDNMQEAQKVFGKEFGGTLFTIAKDVKIQVEFNPNKVQAYRLIGYENRMLEDEDFIDDTKDAGELGSGHTVTALYEVIPVGTKSDYLKEVSDLKYTKSAVGQAYSDELFTVKFRYKKPDGDKSIEMVHIQKDEVQEASEDLKFASAVALFGMQLRLSKYHNNSKIEDVIKLAKEGRGEDKDGYRAEFNRLVKTISQ